MLARPENTITTIGTNWMLLGLFVFPVFVYLNPHTSATKNSFLIGILLPWVIMALSGKIRLFHRDPAFVSGFVLFTYLWATALWNPINGAAEITEQAQYWGYAICLLTAPAVVLRRHPGFLEPLLVVVYVAAIISVAVTLWSHFDTHGDSLFQYRMAGEGFLVNEISLAIHLGIASLIGWYLALHRRRFTWLIVATGILLIAGMVMTHSRGPLIALGICLAIAAYGRQRRLTVFLLLGTSLCLIVLVQLVGWEYFLNRGLSYRPEIWQKTLALTADSLVFGEGFSLNAERVPMDDGRLALHSHNVLVDLLRFGGIVAVALFVWHLVYVYRAAVKCGSDETSLLALILTFSLINMMFAGWFLLDKPNFHWLGYWYPISLIVASQLTRDGATGQN